MLKRISSYFEIQQVHIDERTQKKYSYMPRFTYRSNFPPISGALTSDKGWGCCYRSAQGLVANYLLRYSNSKTKEFFAKFGNRQLLGLFEDKESAPFSIHNMTKICKELFDIAPGTWAKPSQICSVIVSILNQHGFEVLAAVDSNIEPTALDSISTYPLLVLCPLMLGMKAVDQKYNQFLIDVFHRKEFLGIVSGYSAFSYFFVGITDENNLIYFDPHVTKDAVLSTDGHSDFFSQPAHAMQLQSLNPSILIGFVCETKENAQLLLDFLVTHENTPISSHKVDDSLIESVLDIDDLDI